MKAAEARAAWAELTDAQRVALRSVALRNFPGSGLRQATNEIFGPSRGQKALATRTLRALVALGFLKCWEGCQTVYAVTDAARELVRAAADAEKRAKRRLTCAFCWSATRHAKWCKRPAGTSGH